MQMFSLCVACVNKNVEKLLFCFSRDPLECTQYGNGATIYKWMITPCLSDRSVQLAGSGLYWMYLWSGKRLANQSSFISKSHASHILWNISGTIKCIKQQNAHVFHYIVCFEQVMVRTMRYTLTTMKENKCENVHTCCLGDFSLFSYWKWQIPNHIDCHESMDALYKL